MSTVVLSGGGTAGHINPALALAEVLKEKGCNIYYAGTPNGVEARLVPAAGIDFKGFEASGFDRSHPLSLISGVYKISKSTKAAEKWFKEIKPDVVVAFGGYVCVPVARAAEKMGIPLVVHEQNSVMGMANHYLAKQAARVCLTYDIPIEGVDPDKVSVTGNPVRSDIFKITREQGRRYLDIPEDAEMLLVFGGSLGARHINEAITAMKDELLSRPDLYIVHITGPKELDSVSGELDLSDDQSVRYRVMGYQDHMAETLAAADAIVSRAGATSLAEISGKHIPALLVPFPYATADHQTTNAKAYVDAGAAYMIADDELNGDEFKQKVFELVDDADLRRQMTDAAKGFKTDEAAMRLADAVLDVI